MEQSLAFGPYRFDPESLELRQGELAVELPLRSAAVLARLLASPGVLVRRDELVRSVWGETHVTSNSLTEAVSRLRGALEDDAARPRYVETLAGRGYRFVAPVAVAGAPSRRWSRVVWAAAGAGAALAVSIGLLSSGTAPEPPRLVELSAEGEIVEALELPPLRIDGLAASPDGTRLALQVPAARGSEIWVFDRRSRSLRRLSEGGLNAEAVWSADGNAVTWAAKRSGSYDIVRRAADAETPIEVLVSGPADEYPEGWSADGTRLVYSESGQHGDLDLRWLRRLPGSGAWRTEPLVATRSHEYLGSLSGDGRWLAYVSNLAGRWQVYLADLEDGGEARPLGAGEDAFWSASGDALYLVTSGRLAAVRPERATEGAVPMPVPGGAGDLLRVRASGRGGFIAALAASS